jgi:hypothetical protein
MFGLHEDAHSSNEKKLKELLDRSNHQESQFEKLFNEHKTSSEELLAFLANSENFDSETWETMEALRKQLEQQTLAELSQIKDPLDTKKKYSDLRSAQQWIPIR